MVPHPQRRNDLILGHCRAFSEVRCRAVEIQRLHVKFRPERLGQLIDRRPAMGEVAYHLRRHLGREGRNATRRNPMISGEDHDLWSIGMRFVGALPSCHPNRQTLQPSQGAGGLGQLAVPRLGCSNRGWIGKRQIGKQAAYIGKGLEGHERLGC